MGGGGAGGTRGAGGGVMDERCVSGVIATVLETLSRLPKSSYRVSRLMIEGMNLRQVSYESLVRG
jgi:hypothetical protein